MTCVGPCRTAHKPRDLVTDAPCRTTHPHRPKPTWPSGTKSPSDSDIPWPPPFRPEAPSTDESPPPRSALMLGTKTSRPPLIPRFCHLGSASNTLSHAGMRARPRSLAGCSPGLEGHVPLVDFCNCMDPQAQPRPRQTPPLCHGVATARWVAPPPRRHRQPGFHSSGVTPTLTRLRNPHVDLLRQRGFTPNRSTQTPSVAH
jgi:hypothetical protein